MKQRNYLELRRWEQRMAAHGIPEHCWSGLARYIVEHVQVGEFLTAVLCNDLREAVWRADEENIRAIPNYVRFLYAEAPGPCWGSQERVRQWLQNERAVA